MTAPPTAYKNLQVAINNSAAGSCLWVARGRYYTTNGSDETKAFTITKSLTLLGGFQGDELCLADRAGHFQATGLSGGINTSSITDNADRIIVIQGPYDFGQDPDIIIDGFSIDDAHNLDLKGGGIYCEDASSLTLRNLWIRDNSAEIGGGAYVHSTDLEMLDCTFVRNTAQKDGAGLWASAVSSYLEPGKGAHIYNVRFADNQTVLIPSRGGAVYLDDIASGEDVQFMNCVLANNAGFNGGGFYLGQGLLGPGRAKIWNTTITGGTSTTNGGSAIYAESNARAVVWNSIIWGNMSPGPGTVITEGTPLVDVMIEYTVVEDGMSPYECTPMPDCANQVGCNTWSCDPVFGGGLTLVCGSSPAIDQGDSSNVGMPIDVFDVDGDGDSLEAMPFDKNGDDRIQNIIDRGPFETCSL